MAEFRVGRDVRGVVLRKARVKATRQGSPVCVCPDCGFVKTNPRGISCYRLTCPSCGARMAER
jgi:predicted RNA-binding Zn-ribbon protein involved in translation (DUF1610 family)